LIGIDTNLEEERADYRDAAIIATKAMKEYNKKQHDK
jgi:hypothetical protein